MRKFGVTAGDDLENLTQVLGEGASKLQGQFFFFLCSSIGLGQFCTNSISRSYTQLFEQLNSHYFTLNQCKNRMLDER